MRLVEYLEAAGLSQPEFARRARVSQATISQIIRGHVPSIRTGDKIVAASRGMVRLDDLRPLQGDPAAPEDPA